MISESEAIGRILATVSKGPAEKVLLSAALDRFVASDLFAEVPLPSFDNSSMDGYAIRATDSRSSDLLRVTGEQPAGLVRNLELDRGCAVRVFTGAAIPAGADAVIMQEDVELVQSEGTESIRCRGTVEEGENIRRAGADLCRGQKIVDEGARLAAAKIGLLASQGIKEVMVQARPKVAVLSTGDELASPGEPLSPGRVYNSNGPMLEAMLCRLGICDITMAGCGDEFEDTVRTLGELADAHDFVLASGGVSVGARDQIKPALAHLGLPPDLWRVRIKPGKPFLFAHRSGPKPVHVFGLPGNPVSGFVTFLILVRPALLKWMGASETEMALPMSMAAVGASMSNPGNRPNYIRGRLESGRFVPIGLQQSHALFGLSQANALLRMAPDETIEKDALRPVILC